MRTTVLAIVMCLAVAVPHAASQVSDAQLIVPGKRIGRWALVTTIDDLVRRHGPPRRLLYMASIPPVADSSVELVWYEWAEQRIAAATQDGRRVEYIVASEVQGSAPPFKTERGVGFHVTRARLVRAYGEPTAETTPQRGDLRLIYDRLGIAFRFYAGGGLREVIVFRPGTAYRYWHLL
ncbi:MAG: hypothetical protein ACT4P5_09910 [Armatimonadota bacterium]